MNAKETILAWVDAFNKRDAQMAARLYHEDAENLQVAIGVPLKGKMAIQEDLASFFQHIPDNFTNVEHIFVDGDWVILEWSGGGTFYKDKNSAGKTFVLQGCGFFLVKDGQIRRQRGYWDKATWFNQVGLPLD